jgi:hypothetical protein
VRLKGKKKKKKEEDEDEEKETLFHNLGKNLFKTNFIALFAMSQDRAVSIATCQGLYGPRIVSRRGRDFSQPSRLAVPPTQASAQWLLGLFLTVKVAGGCCEPPTPSSPEVKERNFSPLLGLDGLF